MTKRHQSRAWGALQELNPENLAAHIGPDAGDIQPQDFFRQYPQVIGATVMMALDGLNGPHAEYIGIGKKRRPRPTLTEAASMYAETVGSLKSHVQARYAAENVTPLGDARDAWQWQFTRLAAGAGSQVVAAHVICAGRTNIADAFVYPRSVSEQLVPAAEAVLLNSYDTLTPDQQAFAEALGDGLSQTQVATSLLLATVMPSQDVMERMSKSFYGL